MSLITVWVDQKQAKVFKFISGEIKEQEFEGHFPEHHTHGADSREEQKHEEQVFKKLMPQLNDAEEILILGPGMAKNHLKKYLESHSAALGKKIVGCEATDHPTEPQLRSMANKFFQAQR